VEPFPVMIFDPTFTARRRRLPASTPNTTALPYEGGRRQKGRGDPRLLHPPPSLGQLRPACLSCHHSRGRGGAGDVGMSGTEAVLWLVTLWGFHSHRAASDGGDSMIPLPRRQIDNRSRGGAPRGACYGYRPADGRQAPRGFPLFLTSLETRRASGLGVLSHSNRVRGAFAVFHLLHSGRLARSSLGVSRRQFRSPHLRRGPGPGRVIRCPGVLGRFNSRQHADRQISNAAERHLSDPFSLPVAFTSNPSERPKQDVGPIIQGLGND
jgi:hypothetical protein